MDIAKFGIRNFNKKFITECSYDDVTITIEQDIFDEEKYTKILDMFGDIYPDIFTWDRETDLSFHKRTVTYNDIADVLVSMKFPKWIKMTHKYQDGKLRIFVNEPAHIF